MERMSMDFAHALLESYTEACKPLCREIQMPQTAFDILMFLANHPAYRSARDIVAVRGLKANLVSVNVDKLVREGLLERRPDQEDRRRTILVCTESARPVIERGRRFQQEFLEKLFRDVPEEDRAVFVRVMKKVRENLARMPKEGIAK